MNPPEIVVFDTPHPCSYLPGRTARLPHRHPVEQLAPEVFDQRLAEGDRRTGVFLYRTRCPQCRACEPIRLEVARFKPDATQRRMLRRGNELLEVRIGQPLVEEQRVALFNRHRTERGLAHGDTPLDPFSYAEFLTESCVQTLEFSYWHEGRLVAIAIADAGRAALSAVYCYYDPSFQLLSLGTYSVLRQVEFCRTSRRQLLYLGFFIAESPHMSYKARYRPHQRLIGGRWTDFA
jgi:arginyl-tRNA--protein-N-Asp/Glu arginylyltransferase